jgi:glycosyltransferase involved in cell wall biosynthesis
MEAGGVQILATNMAQTYRNQGIPAKVVFLYKKRRTFETDDDIIVLHDGRIKSPIALFRVFRDLFRLLKREKPRAVIGMAHFSSPIATTIAWLTGVKKRVATQTNPPESLSNIAFWLDRIASFLGMYTHNVAASKTIAKCFSKASTSYQRKLRVIYNGVILKPSLLTKEEARHIFSLPMDSFLLVTCGRLSPQKNQVFLLDVLERLPEVHLAILGEGELRHQLEAEILRRGLSERVTLLGEIPPSRVQDFLVSGDIFVFPSIYEAFGLAIVEAMAAGLPIIASNHPALCEVVDEAGVILPLNAERWSNHVDELRADSEAIAAYSKKSKLRAQEFSHEKMAKEFLAVVNEE